MTESSKTEYTAEDLRWRMSASYADFCELMQDDGWFDPVHRRLCNWVQGHVAEAINKGKDAKLMLIMPRGSLKTTIITKYLPIWLTCNDDHMRTLIVSNTFTNACKKLRDIRGVFEGMDIFKVAFPDLLPTRDETVEKSKWTDAAATINRSKAFPDATFEAAGVGTKKTGSHYNMIIEDDTVAPDESEMKSGITTPSRDRVTKGVGYHQQSVPLLVNKGPRIRVVVTTRWGEYDLVSHVRDEEHEWKIFDIPAISGSDVETWWDGTPNFSIFYSMDQLRSIERDVGPYTFACLYLNKPQDASLRVIKEEWISKALSYDSDQVPEPSSGNNGPFHAIMVDPAISESDSACETAISLVYFWREQGRKPYQLWERDISGHFLPDELIRRTVDLAEQYAGTIKAIVVEEVAFQKALKYAFYDELARRGLSIPVIGFASRTKKEVRIEGYLVPIFSSGRVFLGPALSDQVVRQLRQFPTGRLVDIIDSFAMGVKLYETEMAEVVRPMKQVEDPHTFEAILNDIKKSHAKRNDKGPLMRKRERHSMMKTGLGDDVDFKLEYGNLMGSN